MKNIFKTFFLTVTIILIAFSVSVPIGTSYAAQSGMNHFFEQGNEAYKQGDYRQAIDWYRNIWEAGYQGGMLYYNLGNCYYKLDEIGYAILYYEKARKFLPDDPEVNFNLELARLKVLDRIEMPPRFFLFEWWDAAKDFYSIPQLTNLVTIFYIITAIIFIIFLYIKKDRVRKTMLSISVISLLLTLFCGYLLFANIREEKINQQGIILTPNVTILSAPSENSTDMFVLHEGVKVKLDDQREDWVKISLPDGKSGWVKRKHVGVI